MPPVSEWENSIHKFKGIYSLCVVIPAGFRTLSGRNSGILMISCPVLRTKKYRKKTEMTVEMKRLILKGVLMNKIVVLILNCSMETVDLTLSFPHILNGNTSPVPR